MRLKKNGQESETSIHLSVMDFIRLHPKIVPYVIHIPNESKRSLPYGKLLKSMGMRKGVSDLLITIPMGSYHGAWIEIKSEGGKLTPEQENFLNDMKDMGYFTATTYGVDETIEKISYYLNL